MENEKKIYIQCTLHGDSAKIFAEEQRRYNESQPVTIRRILSDYKKMKDNGCKPE